MHVCMERITISLPDEVAARLRREARRRRIPISQLVRDTLDAKAGSGTRSLGFVAIGRSGKRDTSRRVDEILAREWTHARDR